MATKKFKIVKEFYGVENAQQEIAEAVFGKAAVLQAKNDGFTVRKIYETTACRSQCNNVVGKVTKDTTCWICGVPIRYIDDETEPGQCEHILPIIQAIMYLGLYTGRKNLKQRRALLELEYQWAHEKCNLIKNDDVYLKTYISKRSGQQVFGVDKPAITALLRKIWENTPFYTYRELYDEMLHSTYEDIDTFIAARLPETEGRLRAIADHLNSFSAPGLVALVAAVNLTTRIRPTLKGTLNRLPVKYIKLPTPAVSMAMMRNRLAFLITGLTDEKQAEILGALDARRAQTLMEFDAVNRSGSYTEADRPDLERILQFMQVQIIRFILKRVGVAEDILEPLRIEREELRDAIREKYKDIAPKSYQVRLPAVKPEDEEATIAGLLGLAGTGDECASIDESVIESLLEAIHVSEELPVFTINAEEGLGYTPGVGFVVDPTPSGGAGGAAAAGVAPRRIGGARRRQTQRRRRLSRRK
jgi:hypothetical protein